MKWPDPLTRKQFARTLANQSRPAGTRLQPKSGKHTAPDTQRINCRECISFYITWETATPYGCKAHGFKSAQIPSAVVFSTSGEHCLFFRRKPA